MKGIIKILSVTAIILLLAIGPQACRSHETDPGLVQDFSLRDAYNNKISLSNLLEDNESVTIVFFRGHFWGICQAQLVELQQIYLQFRQHDSELVAISMDNLEETQELSRHLGLDYPLLSDPRGEVVKQFGVYNLLGDKVATPSVFVISDDKSVAWKYVGKDIIDRPDSKVILSKVKMVNRWNILSGMESPLICQIQELSG